MPKIKIKLASVNAIAPLFFLSHFYAITATVVVKGRRGLFIFVTLTWVWDLLHRVIHCSSAFPVLLAPEREKKNNSNS